MSDTPRHPPDQVILSTIARASAELRHLYKQMLKPSWSDAKVAEAARGLLGPVIKSLEKAANDAGEVGLSANDASVKILLRLPKSLHEKLRRAAKRDGVSLNQYLVYLLAERNATRT